MNCRQARATLAIYRELQTNQTDTNALEVHLSQCTACKEVQAQYHLTGERLHALPCIEPSPDAHTKLMQALATEHVRFIQHTSASAIAMPTPAFLAPYLKDLAQKTPHSNNLAAFATADTAPIPIVLRSAKRRRIHQINHFTIIGVAASFLIMLLVGSLTSLLLLTHHGGSITPPSLTVHQLNDVRPVNYTVSPFYPHVASAVASGHDIYYTTYNDDETSWQIEQFDMNKKINTPLLTKPSTQEIIVLGSSADWLIWFQIDLPKSLNAPSQPTNDTSITLTRAWSLHARYLGPTPPQATETAPSDIELISNTFNPSTVPGWVNRPIQGICFIQNTLLAAIIDEKGISHLESYQLDQAQGITKTELARANNGHLLTSPTANSDGTAIYWADEYFSKVSGQLNSNIWTQQTVNASPIKAGQWAAHQITEQYLFRADGNSFHPQMVNDILFLLSTSQTNDNTFNTPNFADATQSTLTATGTAQPGSTASAEHTVTPTGVNIATLPGGATKVDPKILTPQIDDMQTGRMLAFSARGVLQALPQFDNNQTVTALQGGTSFLLWQENGKTFEMYDVIAKAPVEVGDDVVSPNATFLAVNGDTVVSAPDQKNRTGQDNYESILATFDIFKWPTPRS